MTISYDMNACPVCRDAWQPATSTHPEQHYPGNPTFGLPKVQCQRCTEAESKDEAA